MDLLYRMDALETVTENGPREARRVGFVNVVFLLLSKTFITVYF